jgi:hypothetical protein
MFRALANLYFYVVVSWLDSNFEGFVEYLNQFVVDMMLQHGPELTG